MKVISASRTACCIGPATYPALGPYTLAPLAADLPPRPHLPEGTQGRRGQGCRGQPLCCSPRPPSAVSFDHLVGADQQGGRERETKRLGGLHVDHQFNFRNLLHREIARLFAFKD